MLCVKCSTDCYRDAVKSAAGPLCRSCALPVVEGPDGAHIVDETDSQRAARLSRALMSTDDSGGAYRLVRPGEWTRRRG